MNMNGYKLVFEDNFEGKELDLNKWQYRGSGARRCGFNAPSQVFLNNGHLILKYHTTDVLSPKKSPSKTEQRSKAPQVFMETTPAAR